MDAAGAAVLGGRVVTVEGEPVPGAKVSWSAWSLLDLEWEPAWQVDDWGPLERAGAEVLTDEHGTFRFDHALSAELGSVVWATHVDHAAGCLLLGPEDPASQSCTVRLEPATPMLARVVDAAGNPAPDAVVLQYGVVPARAARGADGRTPERARRLLTRRCESDPAGIARLAPFPGEQVVIASRGAELSAPWRGSAQGEITLRLSGGFTIGGTVEFPDWSHLDYEGERRLVVEALQGRDTSTLASIRSILDGDWGPIALPILEGASYSLRLEGSPIIPVQLEFGAAHPGEHLSFDLRPELGHALSFFVEDEQRKPIANAEVASFWEESGRERVLRRRGLEDGTIDNWSFPGGVVVRSLVSAPGYGSQWADTVLVPETRPATHRVVLKKGASLRGRCTNAGRPVEDFDVVVWQPGRSRFTQIAGAFRDRRDGSFEMEDVPVGDVEVSASTEILPFCRPVHVVVPSADEVLLDLEDPIPGRGQVVDVVTGEPVEGARVQVVAATVEGALRSWGRSHRTDREGRFEMRAFSTGRNLIRVAADGYAEREVLGAPVDSEIDFERIGLYRPRALELRLFADRPVDFSAITVEGAQGTLLPRKSFEGDGSARFDGVGAGTRFVMLEGTPQAAWVFLRLQLEQGRPWRFSHKVAGRRRLHVDILGESEERAAFMGLSVSYVNREGVQTECGYSIPASGSLAVDGIDADSAQVAIMGPLRTGVSTLAELEGDELFATLDLEGSTLSIRVVDEEGLAVAGALVRVIDSEPTPLHRVATTDEDGRCSFRGLPRRTVGVSIEHESKGRCLGIPVDATAGDVELVLSNEGRLDLRVVDGAVPVPGVEARVLITPIGPRWSVLGSSDELGWIRAEDLGEGPYRVTTDHPDCWPATVEVVAARDPAVTEIQVRRLGSLCLRLETPDGLRIPGRPVELHSLEFETDVEDWVEAARVIASTGLVSDQAGEIRIERLPRGTYRWSVRRSDGESLAGTCDVVAATLVQTSIAIP